MKLHFLFPFFFRPLFVPSPCPRARSHQPNEQNGLKKANGSGGGHAAEHVVYEHSSHGGGGGGGGGWQRSIEPRKPYPRYQYYEEDDLPYWKRRPEHDYQDPYDGA